MNNKNKILLKQLLLNYNEIIKNQKKYLNVENIDNESKTDDEESDEIN